MKPGAWMRLAMRKAASALVCATLFFAGCSASYPTTPTDAVPLGLQVHAAQPLGDASVRSVYTFFAYVLRSDGAWEDVTDRTSWSSPDPVVFRSLGSGRYLAESPGRAGARAQYAGLGAFVDVVVIDPVRQPLPRLSLGAAAPQTIGVTAQATAALLSATGGARDVTNEATWVSSDPFVATVDRGRVTAIGPGTARITVTHSGLIAAYLLSVAPAAR